MSSHNLLLKNCQICDPGSSLHGEQRDIFIQNGRINVIRPHITGVDTRSVDCNGAGVSMGWLDIGVETGDPGFEHREDLKSVSRAAAAGGFTALAPLPNTNPVIHSKAEVLYLKANAKELLVDLYPIGALSKDCVGKDITEMIDMHHAGAKAFSDGNRPVQDSGLMMRALQYVKAFDGLVMNWPQEDNVAGKGQLNEGVTSTTIGTKGIPRLAESLMLQRDIELAEYTDSKLHISNISTADSVALVRAAKKKGLKVSCSVAVLNLFYDDSELLDFNPYFKVLPPLREKGDINALRMGLTDGTIDVICSNHVPIEREFKNVEFSHAKFGAIGLQTIYALCRTELGQLLPFETLLEKIAINPRKILGIPVPKIAEGEQAELTVFDPNAKWVFEENSILSKSKNSPLIGMAFTGKVLGVVNGERTSF